MFLHHQEPTERINAVPLDLESETAAVEFKSAFNPTDKGEFLEILKDIAAMTNSGGGTIVFGLLNDGTPSGADLAAIACERQAKKCVRERQHLSQTRC